MIFLGELTKRKVIMDLKVNVIGRAGAGKSTVARVIVEALRNVGFQADLDVQETLDRSPMEPEQVHFCLKALQGKVVEVSCQTCH